MIADANKSAASRLGTLYRMVRLSPSYLSFSRPVVQNVHAKTSSWRGLLTRFPLRQWAVAPPRQRRPLFALSS